ncbi:hypothetical protein SV7mr_27740 [Stieleria bergensis]|uniref:Uncharacterized protein n=1 Tax=Stieleria bergensis TaxID=2528025 RepID=A0A517SVT9_9BACT|nr:hypothetical protein SV7mr_27740 [Planctomycetes bacterium SV_7m_r]
MAYCTSSGIGLARSGPIQPPRCVPRWRPQPVFQRSVNAVLPFCSGARFLAAPLGPNPAIGPAPKDSGRGLLIGRGDTVATEKGFGSIPHETTFGKTLR